MSPLDGFILIVAVWGILWCLWLLLQFVFDQIDAYHDAWREAKRHEAETEGSAKRQIGARSSDSQ